jgi:16S rRNA (cytidine1402-2'-O)-methyltransferase
MSGQLILCATPIGNLEDITYRVIRTLKEVDYIAAEDTRHTKKLLNAYAIQTPLTSYHEHNKFDKGEELVRWMLEGKTIALVSDAGTPGISDPGEELVKMCYDAGVKVTALPGAIAGVLALIMSGLSTRRFSFEGFFPSDQKERKIILEQLINETRTMILYEAPHRIKKTLKELLDTLGNRNISICRELTKKYEEVKQFTLEEAVSYYELEDPRGEYVLIIEGKPLQLLKQEEQNKWQELSIEEHMNYYMEQGILKKEAMKKVAKDRGLGKRDIYQYLIQEEE